MIILVRPADYGGNAIRYATEKEKAQIIKVNHMPADITPIAMWHRMKMHCLLHRGQHTHGRPMKNFMVTFVFSPDPQECEGWTTSDWDKFQDEVLREIDRVSISHLPKCKKCKSTNFHKSMNVSALHRDSASGKLHLHVDCCRLDLDGHTNDTNQIHTRCMKAAEEINRCHGWRQPAEIREERRRQIVSDCVSVLQGMRTWNLNAYFARLGMKGYEVEPIPDKSTGQIHGYTVACGASVFKASELDTSRKLLVSHLEDTWKKLHKDEQVRAKPSQERPRKPSILERYAQQSTPQSTPTTPVPAREQKPATTLFRIKAGDKVYDCHIPDTVKDIFTKEAELPDDFYWSKLEDITHTAMLLFCGYLDAATTISQSCGGGCSSSDTKGWGKDKDEDDWQFARRCIAKALHAHEEERAALVVSLSFPSK